MRPKAKATAPRNGAPNNRRWLVTARGRTFTMMSLEGCTAQEAIDYARAFWPDCTVEAAT